MINDLLSIIVPAYNAEKTINRCILSIICQSNNNFEIIIVNDCSTDDTQKNCLAFQQNDKRIKLIILDKNCGVSVARNIGIEKAAGGYLMFVDSDDYLEPNAIKVMMNKLQNDGSSLVIGNCWNVYNNGHKELAFRKMRKYENDPLRGMELEQIPTAIWCRIIRKDLMWVSDKNRCIQFQEGRRYEDTLVAFKQILAASNVSIIDEPLYNYTKSEDSITSKPCESDIYDLLKNADEMKQLLDATKNSSSANCYICSIYIYALHICKILGEQTLIRRKNIHKQLKQLSKNYTFKDAFKCKNWKKKLLCKIGFLYLLNN